MDSRSKRRIHINGHQPLVCDAPAEGYDTSTCAARTGFPADRDKGPHFNGFLASPQDTAVDLTEIVEFMHHPESISSEAEERRTTLDRYGLG